MSDETRWGSLPPEDEKETGVTSPRYAHYQMHQDYSNSSNMYRSNPNMNAQPLRRPEKKKNDFGKKLMTTTALAIVFGLVAGVVFQGVNYAAGVILPEKQTANVEQAEILTEEISDDSSVAIEDIVTETGTVAGVAQIAMPSVVAITSVSIQEIPTYFGMFGFGYGVEEYPSTGSGSGIIVGENDDELLIATNNHVVEGATTLSVCFIGSDVIDAEAVTQSYENGDINIEDAVSAKIKGADPDNDLAVISVKKGDIPDDTMSEIKIAQIGNSEELIVGEQVVAIGNALGYGQSVTSGWVSALNRSITLENGSSAEVIQTDAAINPGNSGGALLNMNGELIGINSAKYADNAVEGMGYAIPISKAEPILQELMNRETRDKVDESEASFLGVQVADLSAEAIQMYNMPAGAFVIETTPYEAAYNAGIQKGDIIVKLDGQKVSGNEDLIEKLQYYAAGEVVEIVIARAKEGEYVEQTIEVTLGSRPESE